jgi:single-stranded DNA-binding protein
MSSSVLVSGRIWRDPERKTTKAGKAYATATIRDSFGDDTTWWKLLTFSETAAEELLSLHDGDSIAASGSFKAEIYNSRDGARISLTVFADRIISAKRAKKRPPSRGPSPGPGPRQSPKPRHRGPSMMRLSVIGNERRGRAHPPAR